MNESCPYCGAVLAQRVIACSLGEFIVSFCEQCENDVDLRTDLQDGKLDEVVEFYKENVRPSINRTGISTTGGKGEV